MNTHILSLATQAGDQMMHLVWTKLVPLIILAGIIGIIARIFFDGLESFVTRKVRGYRNRGAKQKDAPQKAESNIVEGDAPHCPTCNRVMVSRESRRGANKGSRFWGCSAYPQCRGTRESTV